MSNSILSNEGVVPLHHCQMPSLQEHSATWGEMDPRAEWPRSQERSSPLFRKISFAIPEFVDDMWNDYIIQILRHMLHLSSLHLVYGWCELLFQAAFTSDICYWMVGKLFVGYQS